MATKRGEAANGADQGRRGVVADLGARRAERDEQLLEGVVALIHEELVRQGVSTLKVPIIPLAATAGSLARLRKAARLAGARCGWAQTRTTKVVDDEGAEWLVVYEWGRDLRLVGGMDSRLRRALESLPAPGKFDR